MLEYKIIEIFTSETASWNGMPVSSSIVDYVAGLKIAARTIVTKAVEGSYEGGEVASGRLEVLSYNLPVRIAIILPEQEAESVLQTVQERVTDGIVALRDINVVSHKTKGYLMPKRTLVKDFMTPSPVKVYENTPLDEVARHLLSSIFTGVPVVDEKNHPIGIVTQGDLIYKAHMPLRLGLLAGPDSASTARVFEDLSTKTVSEVMSKPAIIVEQDQAATAAVDIMLEKKVKRLPVVDATGQLVGILSRLDVFQTILKECPDWRFFQRNNVQVEDLKSVSDIVRHDAYTVLPDTPIDEVIRIIDSNDIERICVVDKDGTFQGLISDSDLLIAFVDRHPGIWDYLSSRIPFTEKGRRHRELQELLKAKTAAEIMKADVVTIRDDAPLEEAIHLMLDQVIKRLPVIDVNGHYKGMISRDSLLRAGFSSHENHAQQA